MVFSKNLSKHSPEQGISFLEVIMVLIVSSLIVASVLVGRDLYSAAKLRNLLSQLRQLDNGVTAFAEKHIYLPGDLPQAGTFNLQLSGVDCTTPTSGKGCGGNGNSRLEDSKNSNALFDAELADFWIHLSNSQFLEEPFNGQNVVGEGFVQTSLGRGGVHVYSLKSTLSNYYHVGAATPPGDIPNALYFENILTPKDAYNIDQKLDDTLPREGLVRAFSSHEASATVSSGAPGDDSACIVAGKDPAIYNTQTQKQQCQVRIRFGT